MKTIKINNPSSKLFLIIQLTIILLATFLLPAWETDAGAYWLEDDASVVAINDLRKDAPPSDRKDLFTVPFYDGAPADRDANTPAILPHSDYFIPADIIDANLPIFGLFSHPAQPAKDPLANLLYANLKLKKLLDEYAATQESAIKYLGRHTSVKGQFQSLLPQQTAAEKEPSDRQINTPTYKPILSYYNNFRNLREKISSTPRHLILAGNIEQKEQVKDTTPAPILEVYKRKSITSGLVSNQPLPGYNSHYSTFQHRQWRTSAPRAPTDELEQEDAHAEKYETRADARDNFRKFIVSTWQSIMDHKLESAIYAIMIILAINFLAKVILTLLGL